MARVILESEDKEQFEVLREVAVKSTVIRQMIETNPDNDEPIPLVDRRCCHVIYRQFICFEFVFIYRILLTLLQLQIQHTQKSSRLLEEASRI
jgi:hypothetical protein